MSGGSKNFRVDAPTADEALQELVDDFLADMEELDAYFYGEDEEDE